MRYDLTSKFFDQPDRFGLDVTISSISDAMLGRQVASVLEKSSAPIAMLSESDVLGKVSRSVVNKVISCFIHMND